MTRSTPIPDTVTLHIPFSVVKHGGRKEMLLPDDGATQSRRTNSMLIKALARAFRWKHMLDSGKFTMIAEREEIAPAYMTRVLRLPLIAPDIFNSVLSKRASPTV